MRVVEFAAFVAGPLSGATLAALGADVIRVEQLKGGPDAQRWPLHEGRSLYRAGLDRGKRSVALDLRSSRGQELAAALVTAPGEGAAIFVTNLGGNGWASYETLSAARNDLIMVRLGGTPDGRPAVDYTVNAGIGFPLVTGPAEYERPINHVLPAWDVSAGLLAAAGILAAERHWRLTGRDSSSSSRSPMLHPRSPIISVSSRRLDLSTKHDRGSATTSSDHTLATFERPTAAT